MLRGLRSAIPLRLVFLAGFGAPALIAPNALANGRFPAAGQIVVDPGDPNHLVVRATYGILQSTDGGATFRWICEQSVGFAGIEDPAVAILKGGTLLAGIFAGLSVSHDFGCTWAFAPAPLEDEYVIDVAIEPETPTHAVAITSTNSAQGVNVVLAETTDAGKTWTAAGVPIDKQFLALTVEVAPSKPSRVYVSGLYGSSYEGALQRTDDRGKTWTMFPMSLPTGAHPYIGAVDPQNPDRVYVRVDASPHDLLLVSDDGGESFVEAVTGLGDMLGFALAPDGSKVAIGGPDFGVRVASASTLAFSPAAKVSVKCLKWHPSALYACGDEFEDGFTVGRSMDDGATFEAVYHLPDLAPLECPSGTPTGELCPSEWSAVQQTLAGSGGGSSAAEATGAGGATSGDDDGGCRAGARAPAPKSGWIAVLAVAALGAVRRRRARDRCQREISQARTWT